MLANPFWRSESSASISNWTRFFSPQLNVLGNYVPKGMIQSVTYFIWLIRNLVGLGVSNYGRSKPFEQWLIIAFLVFTKGRECLLILIKLMFWRLVHRQLNCKPWLVSIWIYIAFSLRFHNLHIYNFIFNLTKYFDLTGPVKQTVSCCFRRSVNSCNHHLKILTWQIFSFCYLFWSFAYVSS